MASYVTHLESAIDGTHLEADRIQTLHEGRPLWVRYNLDAVAADMSKEKVSHRTNSMWRYRELLPAPWGQEVTLGEGMSPLLGCPKLGEQLGLENLWIKDESQLPTGSFKSRGLSMALSMARHFGIQRVAIPPAGNAGGATAAYAARAGIEAFVFMPEDTPVINQYEARSLGAHVFLVNGLINDCARIVREGKTAMNWFDLSTLKEPYRIEGKKTMGLELAEQFEWELPDVILYPTGGGTGLIGMWKAFHELRTLGWLHGGKMPRMVSVQSAGCEPIARAFRNEERFADPHQDAHTCASGLRVPVAVGDFMILDAVRQSGGTAISVDEDRIAEWTNQAAAAEGISVCPETGACIGALQSLRQEGWIQPNECVVVFNTGALQKYLEVMQLPTKGLPFIDLNREIDFDYIEQSSVSRSSIMDA